jgi:PAS domain S-box-containing protein
LQDKLFELTRKNKKLLRDKEARPKLEAFIEKKSREMYAQKNQIIETSYFFQSVIYSMEEILLVFSPGGYIKFINPAALNMLKLSEKEIIGKSFNYFLKSLQDSPETIDFRYILDRGPIIKSFEVLLQNNSDKVIPVTVSGVHQFNEDRQLTQVVCVCRDIRQYKNIISQLKELSTAKSLFITLASHELLTPLTILKSYIENMKKGIFKIDGSRSYLVLN